MQQLLQAQMGIDYYEEEYNNIQIIPHQFYLHLLLCVCVEFTGK